MPNLRGTTWAPQNQSNPWAPARDPKPAAAAAAAGGCAAAGGRGGRRGTAAGRGCRAGGRGAGAGGCRGATVGIQDPFGQGRGPDPFARARTHRAGRGRRRAGRRGERIQFGVDDPLAVGVQLGGQQRAGRDLGVRVAVVPGHFHWGAVGVALGGVAAGGCFPENNARAGGQDPVVAALVGGRDRTAGDAVEVLGGV